MSARPLTAASLLLTILGAILVQWMVAWGLSWLATRGRDGWRALAGRARRREGEGKPMSTDTMASITEHLEFLGYRCEAQDDGWTLAVHPTRPDFFARVLSIGVRLVAIFTLNGLDEARRAQWLWFANRCNEAGLLVKFALVAGDEGGYVFRATAYGPLAYERTTFGAFMDLWHRDLALMEHAPPVGQASEGEEPEEGEEEGVAGKAEVTH